MCNGAPAPALRATVPVPVGSTVTGRPVPNRARCKHWFPPTDGPEHRVAWSLELDPARLRDEVDHGLDVFGLLGGSCTCA